MDRVERVKAFDFVLQVEREKAKERQGERTDKHCGKTSTKLDAGKSRDLAAKKFGVSGKTME